MNRDLSWESLVSPGADFGKRATPQCLPSSGPARSAPLFSELQEGSGGDMELTLLNLHTSYFTECVRPTEHTGCAPFGSWKR